MGVSEKIKVFIQNQQDKKRKSQSGPEGNFWKNGGNALLFDLPVETGSTVIDAGGFEGEWTSNMLSQYGCKSIIFEPVPDFANHCSNYFKNNKLVTVNTAALGGNNRSTTFSLSNNGTSEYLNSNNIINAKVRDIADVFKDLNFQKISCLKLNIEGGEYEVLERLIETKLIALCESLLIQFHRQPEGYKERYTNITNTLKSTHTQSWSYYMVWEKWILNK